MQSSRGYIHVYTGSGKGKTTAALGLALRAAGAGKRVFIAQFVKGIDCSEHETLRRFLPQVEFRRYGTERFVGGEPGEEDVSAARRGLSEVREILSGGGYDVVILDEANLATHFGLFSPERLLEVLRAKPEATELVVTGRHAAPEIVEAADLVTEMREVKHYFARGVEARRGIEY